MRFTLAAAALLTPTSGLHAQGLRGTATSTVRYIGLQPLAQDTVAIEAAVRAADGSYTIDGIPVSCLPAIGCTRYRLDDRTHAVAATEDVRFTAWGFGVEGLSATAYVRGRRQFDGAYPWPRADDAFDALLAYVQFNRTGLRVRLGRQETLSGLGFASFDGANVLTRPHRLVRIEAFGGRSLARGLREPRNEALRGVDDFVPENEAYLFGGAFTLAHPSGTSVVLRYQRENWSDGSTLLSERASGEFRTRLTDGLHLAASGDWDFGTGAAGKASASVRARVRPWLDVELRGRRYLPYFDLSTIWGFFEPVGYNEGHLRLGLRSERGVDAWVSAGRRSYGATETVVVFSPLENDAWTVDAGALWSPTERWSGRASYRLEWGVGAYLQSGDAALSFRPVPRSELTVHGSIYQQLEEFRLGDRRMAGGGISGSLGLGARTRLHAGWLRYGVLGTDGADPLIGPQTRGWLSLEFALGSDPGPGGGR